MTIYTGLLAVNRAIICDIDGTIADIDHRRHHVREKPKNWKKFNDLMHLDGCHYDICHILDIFHNSGETILLTSGRSEDQRKVTEEWLDRYIVPYKKLYMRKSGDYRSDDIVKREILAEIRADGYEPWLAIDDRDRVVKMWRDEGIRCLQVCEGDF